MSSPSLPIEASLPALQAALSAHRNVVLQAPPGAGKSTGVPLALLEAPAIVGKIVMLEPRRIAARAIAARMAYMVGEPVGRTVGYRTRLESKVGRETRIEVVTEGILTRWLQRDPALEGIGIVIFDEFHERSLNADLGLALCLDAQESLREDLKILVMSATLDGAAVATLLGGAPIVSKAGAVTAIAQTSCVGLTTFTYTATITMTMRKATTERALATSTLCWFWMYLKIIVMIVSVS